MIQVRRFLQPQHLESYAMYNDQSPLGTISGKHAHSKGLLITDSVLKSITVFCLCRVISKSIFLSQKCLFLHLCIVSSHGLESAYIATSYMGEDRTFCGDASYDKRNVC